MTWEGRLSTRVIRASHGVLNVRRHSAKVQCFRNQSQIDYLQKGIRDKKHISEAFSGAAVWRRCVHDWTLRVVFIFSGQTCHIRFQLQTVTSGCPIPKDAMLDKLGELKFHEWYFRVGRSSANAGVSNYNNVQFGQV